MAIKGQSDPEANNVFGRAVEVCRHLGDPEMEARSLFALGAIAMSCGELQSVQEISANLLDLAEVAPRITAIAIAGHVRFGILTFYQGQLNAARDNLSRALDSSQRLLHWHLPETRHHIYTPRRCRGVSGPHACPSWTPTEKAIAHADRAVSKPDGPLAPHHSLIRWRCPPRREHAMLSATRRDAATTPKSLRRRGG